MRIYLLVALAQYEAQVTADLGAWLLALSAKPAQERYVFHEAGPLDAYYIQAEHVLNIACPMPAFWTPVNLWRVTDFDAPAGYPSVMWEGVEPERPSVRPLMDSADGLADQPHKSLDFDWTPPRKEVLKVMVKYAEKSLEMSLGALADEAGVGKSTVSAVKKAVEADRRLLNGLGQKILGAQP